VYVPSSSIVPTLHPPSIYSEIITHAALDLMTKLTEYPSLAKQDAKIEAEIRKEEAKMLLFSRKK
tara:strand:+ start:520 stop:714 length:195 start_codon:yes stop_codon:yes gene_type:complete